MIISILFFLSVIFPGLLLLEIFKIYLNPLLTILSASILGNVITLLILFLISNLFGLNLISSIVPVISISLISVFILFKKFNFPESLAEIRLEKKPLDLIPFLLMILIIVVIFNKSIFITSDYIIAGNRLVWVDWPVHISFISSFLKGDNFPPQNPLHAGEITTYPFFVEFLSAILQSLGSPLKSALVIPGVILSTISTLLLYSFASLFFKNKKVAIIGVFVGLFSGGLGFLYFIKDLLISSDFYQTLFFPPHEYTFYADKNLWFFTFLYSELLPQRAFLLGLPIFFTSLILLILGISKNKKSELLISAYLAAILPFFHMHSFISILIVSFGFILMTFFDLVKTKKLNLIKNFLLTITVYYVLPILGLGLIQAPFFLEVSGQSFAPHFGWMSQGENIFIFWFKNTGFFWPLWLVGFFKIENKRAKYILLSSVLLFLLPNIFRFAPWPYDNLKIFTYWYLIGSFSVAWALYFFWKKNLICKILAITLFISLVFSGFLEITRIINTNRTSLTLWAANDIELAKSVSEKTEPNSVILAAAVHDHPISSLSGRKMIIGFPGNAWSWGFSDWQQREMDVGTMLRAETSTEALFSKYDVDYVLISNREKAFEPLLNEEYFRVNGSLVSEGEDYKLYKVND